MIWRKLPRNLLDSYVAHGIAQCEQALALDRNLPEAHGLIGMAKFVLGRGAETEIHIHEALRLSPRDILAYRWFLIVGHRSKPA
jgi:hypothetical protein